MSQQPYSIRWETAYHQTREKFFGSLKDLRKFRNVHLKHVENNFSYFYFDGVRYEQFVFLESQILTKSQFYLLKDKFQ